MTALITAAIDWLTHLGCAHQDIFRRSDGCLSVECLKCGRQTVGIAVHRTAQARANGGSRFEHRAPALQRAA